MQQNEEEQEDNQYFLAREEPDLPVEDIDVLSLKEAIADCVAHHQIILEFGKNLEDYFCYFLLSKLLFTGEDDCSIFPTLNKTFYFQAFLVCVIAYVLSTLEEFSVIRVGNLMFYLILSTSELLLFNFSAELLKYHVSAHRLLNQLFIEVS